jgi:hypothetical protein
MFEGEGEGEWRRGAEEVRSLGKGEGGRGDASFPTPL